MKKYKVLVVHCAYQQQGGEDMVVDAEVALLRRMGHEVRTYIRTNADIRRMSLWRVAADAIWAHQTHQDIERLTEQWRPDVIHVHNTLLLISPSIFWIAAKQGIPVVQTMHNFRTACLNATFLREGAVCEDCLGKVPLAGIRRACYRDSMAQSAVLASSLVTHRMLGTYGRKVNRFIALTRFARHKLAEGGLPEARISVKPNFVPYRALASEVGRHGGIFAGRLSAEKGIAPLLGARQLLDPIRYPMDIHGTGPLESEVKTAFGDHLRGHTPIESLMQAMETAEYLIVPSVCYEGGFPRTAIEAFACGTPVIASRLGSMAEFIEDKRTGLLFEPGNAQDLARCIQWATEHPSEMREMGRHARSVYEQQFTPERNHDALLHIYQQAIDEGALTT